VTGSEDDLAEWRAREGRIIDDLWRRLYGASPYDDSPLPRRINGDGGEAEGHDPGG